MARGVKKSIEEKISEKQNIICELENRILKEKEELEDLLLEQKNLRLEKLDKLISDTNLTFEELESILKHHNEQVA